MREEEFRSWLEGRTWEGGPITTAGHRLSRANRFERAMGELGLGWPDLDAAYDDDRQHEPQFLQASHRFKAARMAQQHDDAGLHHLHQRNVALEAVEPAGEPIRPQSSKKYSCNSGMTLFLITA
jgi:hypothetical protein